VKSNIEIGKVKVSSFFKHALIANAVVSIIYCTIKVIALRSILFDPPNIMIDSVSASVSLSPLPYIIGPFVYLVFGCFAALTVIELAAVTVYNLSVKKLGGIRVNVRLKDEIEKE
jgi:hypothetical protein